MSAEHTTLVKGDKVLEKVGDQIVAEKDYVRVLSGYKATAHKQNLPEETRKHAEEMIQKLEESHAASVGEGASGGSGGGSGADEQQHQHRVAGGLKAAIHNPNVSEEAKQSAQEKLEKLGEA
ncbi:BZ3500_MvSof-1268-A1-R1_Chr12-2g03721 [Microbotryum saponariae]|uniref:BZ3500_MvSof-1268-A1-R1_Chr12-2g03721 protein n=1 Tax=Microbotryum saponariae TaxID=289078 RepID=A0A2X0LE02_9BASI|nr:BZ3500_MvSof-1268-A1-R1_Chr12-2g03721 [Microbotryum saponariae]SDA05309.1 BZ3501_MvSof-1269-A2-R1_Chr12-1g03293 [Microbotryum saponariae]